MSKPRTTNAEPRTKNPVFPLRIDPHDPHRIVDSSKRWNAERQVTEDVPRLVDSYVSSSDAQWVCDQRNRRWEAAELLRIAEEEERAEALRQASLIPEVRPNQPAEDQP